MITLICKEQLHKCKFCWRYYHHLTKSPKIQNPSFWFSLVGVYYDVAAARFAFVAAHQLWDRQGHLCHSQEQLWQSFSESASMMGSARKLSREVEEAFVTNTLKNIKTVRKSGKKVGFRCLRVWTQHLYSADVSKEQNIVSLEGMGKSGG